MSELLAPAGSYESLRAAVNAGADAVYVGGSRFGARAYADNPDEVHLIQGIEYCHLHGRKLYLTVNTLLKERELEEELYPYLLPYYESGVDGLIVQDFGVMQAVRRMFPDLPVHASTQMTVTGVDGVRFLQKQGVSRIVLARELSLEEVRRIIAQTGAEIETFIHGAMCYSYSGQCLFSSLLGGRSGNRGRCAQPCRLPYRVVNGRGPGGALLSMKDMCAIDLLPDILEAGIASLKIEGRMKRPEYAAGVVRVYRRCLDLYMEKGREGYHVSDRDRAELLDLYNRGGFSQGYYRQRNGRGMISPERPNHMGTAAARIQGRSGPMLKAVALEPLGKQDVLELAPGAELTLQENVAEGAVFSIPADRTVLPVGTVLCRTRNESLLRELKRQFMDQDCREKVSGELQISADAPALLRLACRGVKAEVSAQIASRAVGAPVTVESVERQMRRTGNTPFVFETFSVELEDGLFVPVSQLNELRRRGLSLLQERLLASGRRAAPEVSVGTARGEDAQPFEPGDGGLKVNVLVTTREQLDTVLEYARTAGSNGLPIDTICLDSLLFCGPGRQDGQVSAKSGLRRIAGVREAGFRCFFVCPPIWRDSERELFGEEQMRDCLCAVDGYLVHTIDELSFFQNYREKYHPCAQLAAGERLYAYNRQAAAFLRSQGVGRITLPSELNARELSGLEMADAELPVYGYQELMQSAQCVVKNTSGCAGRTAVTYLEDRRRARFPVLSRCAVCCNTVYNSVPLALGAYAEEIRRLAPAYVRLAFTVETGEETGRVLRQFEAAFSEDRSVETPGGEGTRGHFKRGVE